VFGKLFYANCGQYGPITATNDSRITVSGNLWQGTSTLVN